MAGVFGRDLVQGAPCGQNGMGWGMVVYVLIVPRVRGEAVVGFGWYGLEAPVGWWGWVGAVSPGGRSMYVYPVHGRGLVLRSVQGL